MKLIIGLLLIAIGSYVAWEANDILSSELFQFATLFGRNSVLSINDVQTLNSFLADILFNSFGAETLGDLDQYLSISRIVGIVFTVLGLGITIQYFKK